MAGLFVQDDWSNVFAGLGDSMSGRLAIQAAIARANIDKDEEQTRILREKAAANRQSAGTFQSLIEQQNPLGDKPLPLGQQGPVLSPDDPQVQQRRVQRQAIIDSVRARVLAGEGAADAYKAITLGDVAQNGIPGETSGPDTKARVAQTLLKTEIPTADKVFTDEQFRVRQREATDEEIRKSKRQPLNRGPGLGYVLPKDQIKDYLGADETTGIVGATKDPSRYKDDDHATVDVLGGKVADGGIESLSPAERRQLGTSFSKIYENPKQVIRFENGRTIRETIAAERLPPELEFLREALGRPKIAAAPAGAVASAAAARPGATPGVVPPVASAAPVAAAGATAPPVVSADGQVEDLGPSPGDPKATTEAAAKTATQLQMSSQESVRFRDIIGADANGKLRPDYYTPKPVAQMARSLMPNSMPEARAAVDYYSGDPQAGAFNNSAKAEIEPIIRFFSQGQVRPDEYPDYYEMFIPNGYDSPQAAQNKMDRLTNWQNAVATSATAGDALAKIATIKDETTRMMAARIAANPDNLKPPATATSAPVATPPTTTAPPPTPTTPPPVATTTAQPPPAAKGKPFIRYNKDKGKMEWVYP